MSQNPGHEDPHHDPNAPHHEAGAQQHDPNAPHGEGAAPRHEGGYQAAPSYDTHGAHDGAPAGAVAKPQPVGLAEKLMYAGGVVSLVTGLVGFFESEDSIRDRLNQASDAMGTSMTPEMIDQQVAVAPASALVSGLIAALLWFLVGRFCGKGKGWARIVATVLAVLNVISFVVGLLGSSMIPGAGGGTVVMLLNAVSAIIAAVVLFFLWKKESTAYFKATR
ncbi:hypothetical protein [uncultured Serinicoccus sp.]|uniref:hypothetical protein n=1 Tax=uncultured Serinicoccus sp. TaxID=735514 RepID=UPI002623E255|nr:hypothetical protein [uncultured Serinicoccus sp.]